jgi:DNA-binding NarL/FixJ family response regulator
MKKVTTAIIEDKRETREYLREFIATADGFQCVGAFPNAETALKNPELKKRDVILMDLNLPGMSGIECTGKIKANFPNVKVLVFTVYEDAEKIFEALKAGADGYLLKKTNPGVLLDCVREVVNGGAPMSSAVAAHVVRYFHEKGKRNAETSCLSPRESEVLELLAKGHLYKEIADSLGISYETVNYHIKNIYQKLHVRSRSEAAAKFFSR